MKKRSERAAELHAAWMACKRFMNWKLYNKILKMLKCSLVCLILCIQFFCFFFFCECYFVACYVVQVNCKTPTYCCCLFSIAVYVLHCSFVFIFFNLTLFGLVTCAIAIFLALYFSLHSIAIYILWWETFIN